ncbi:hypothetical protein KI659_04645 [Litoribacter alkaliphilus]|uniref:Universal stress protein n=1 Tax=Litoribacter ruber TaxID=702568 RepID=A0AAP2CHG0_9BACT|nr:hypothetical protein [Litoribacter alkaliphilus]MBS9523301.1 hypothetical protein [Litoribacter alkaliphilus]
MNRIKIIIGFGGKLDHKEIDFIFKLIPREEVLFVGAVVNDLIGGSELPPCQSGKCDKDACRQKKENEARKSWYRYFGENCKKSHCKYTIHKEDGCSSTELMRETHYADLMIINQETYRGQVKNEAGDQVPFRSLLTQSGCPVLVIPANTMEIDQVVMTFDGSTRAMHGIKQFSYLLSELGQNLPVTVLTTYCEEGPSAMEEKLFIEYLKQHFHNLALHKLSDETEHTIYTAVGLNSNTLMVVNNPSPENLTVLGNLLNSDDSIVPFKLYTQTV